MGAAKDIVLRPISGQDANALVRRVHYSGKVVNNSQLHIGVFYQGRLEGAMQFGPSLDKRKIMGLVEGTRWNEFIELNRMAFTDTLPRNSESRALSIAMRLIKKHAPHIKWVVTFADAAQCGDGTIYRAAGFVLTGIRENNSIWALDGNAEADAREASVSLTDPSSAGQKAEALRHGRAVSRTTVTKGKHIVVDVTVPSQSHRLPGGGASMKPYQDMGYKPIPGFQLRYIYFIDPTARERLTVPILPFSEIERRGAGMYKGERVTREQGETDSAPETNRETGDASSTCSLYSTDSTGVT